MGRIKKFGLDVEYEVLFAADDGCAVKVSYCIKCYNHERFVAKAIESAFRQTFDDFEILIYDDCSPDSSCDIAVRELRKWFAKRRVPVRLIRGNRNLGNLGGWMACIALAQGELVVKADGDDISFPQRVEKLYSAWIEAGKKAAVVTSPVVRFADENGACLGLQGPVGASIALRRDALEGFPDILPEVFKYAWDDQVTVPRCTPQGGTLVVKDPLVFYRIGSGYSTDGCWRRRLLRILRNELYCARQWSADVQSGRLEGIKVNQELADCQRHITHASNCIAQYTGDSFAARYRAFRLILSERRLSLRERLLHLALLLPSSLTDCFFDCSLRISEWLTRWKYRGAKLSDYCNEISIG